jgi:hypothetical protein
MGAAFLRISNGATDKPLTVLSRDAVSHAMA